MVDDYDQRYVYTITADGKFRLVMTQRENGLFQSANGVYRTIGAKTHRVRTGTYRAVGVDAIEVASPTGSAIFRPTQAAAPINPANPVMLGTWRATIVQGGLNWTLTLQNNANGSFEYTAQAEDTGSCGFANNQWHLASAVTGQSDMGTYRVVDAQQHRVRRRQGFERLEATLAAFASGDERALLLSQCRSTAGCAQPSIAPGALRSQPARLGGDADSARG